LRARDDLIEYFLVPDETVVIPSYMCVNIYILIILRTFLTRWVNREACIKDGSE
jgi:hypothetical protein